MDRERERERESLKTHTKSDPQALTVTGVQNIIHRPVKEAPILISDSYLYSHLYAFLNHDNYKNSYFLQ